MFCSQIFNFNDFVWDSGSLIDEGSVFEHVEKRMDSSSASSDCHVDTTTGNGMDSKPGWKGANRQFITVVAFKLTRLHCSA